MALRQLEIYFPEGGGPLPPLEKEYELVDRRDLTLASGDHYVRLLVETKNSEALLDWLSKEIGDIEGHRIVMLKVASTLPREKSKEKEEDDQDGESSGVLGVSRISRDEVYQSVEDSIGATKIHHVMVILATIVATGGLLRDSTAIVIGAMVIAPHIGPNIALSLGTTLADFDLIKRALRINLVGLAMSFVLAAVAGFFLSVDITAAEIASRTELNVGDVALALAAGVAGVLSVTRGTSTALIGVMVAVALLPPLVVTGLMVGMGNWGGAYGAAMLTVTNIVAINLAGVVTFLVQGIRPIAWYEEEEAKRARFIAIGLWFFILLGLIIMILSAPPAPV